MAGEVHKQTAEVHSGECGVEDTGTQGLRTEGESHNATLRGGSTVTRRRGHPVMTPLGVSRWKRVVVVFVAEMTRTILCH